MNELALFSLALGLAKPWRVGDLKFSKEEGRLDLRLDFANRAKFPCPSCMEECQIYLSGILPLFCQRTQHKVSPLRAFLGRALWAPS